MVALREIRMQKGEAGWKIKWLFLGNSHPPGGVWDYRCSYGRKSGLELLWGAKTESEAESRVRVQWKPCDKLALFPLEEKVQRMARERGANTKAWESSK